MKQQGCGQLEKESFIGNWKSPEHAEQMEHQKAKGQVASAVEVTTSASDVD